MSFRAARQLAADKDSAHSKSAPRSASAASHAGPTGAAAALAASSSAGPAAVAVPPSTRLCVKNLPVHVGEDRLRAVFGAPALGGPDAVTDVKLLRTSDGRSRKMAFIGFRSLELSAKALKHFHKSFIDTSRVEVEYAVNPREARDALRPWSKYSEGSSRHDEHLAGGAAALAEQRKAAAEQSASSKSGSQSQDPLSLQQSAVRSSSKFSKSALFGLASDAQLAGLMNDPKFQEYLHVMGSRSHNKFWSNNLADISTDAVSKGKSGGASMLTTAEEMASVQGEKSYQTYEQFLASEKKGGKGGKGKAGAESDDDDDDAFNQPMLDRDVDDEDASSKSSKPLAAKPKSKQDSDDEEEDATAAPVSATALDTGVSDLDYLRSKQKDDSNFDDDSDMEDATPAVVADAQQAAPKSKKRKHGDTVDSTTAESAAAVSTNGGMHPSRAAQAAAGESQADGEEDGEDGGDAELRAEYERDQERAEQSASSLRDSAELLESGRLFLRNLSYTVREEDVRALLSPFGTLAEVHVPLDATPEHKPKGFAYASFLFPAEALAAQRALDGSFFLGRLLHILNARPKPESKSSKQHQSDWDKLQALGDDEKNKVSYKKKKELEMQAHASSKKDQASWNTLFVRSDTVTEAIASKYGLSKSDILDVTSSAGGEGGDGAGMAVRLALAETQLINETKKFLAAHGVRLEAFSGPKTAGSAGRSNRAIIVKNLPFTCELDEVRRLFAKFGGLTHCVMPPSRALVLLEFAEARDALAAFKGLAYKKFKYVPLYLEWAPKGAFEGTDEAAGAAAAAGVIEGKSKASELLAESPSADDDAAAGSGGATESSTLYVKNLSFSTTEAALSDLFSQVAPVRSVTISRKKNTKARPGTADPAFLSMGYGFVEFRNGADAARALKQMQGKQLDNHALDVKLSSRGASTSTTPAAANKSAAAAKGTTAAGGAAGGAALSSKLLVKNVPFETTARDLRDLFSAFGTIQRIRLPKKFGQLGHRGFAFIDMATKSEAAHAMEQVKHSHLYGRHLVIEYAAPSADHAAGDGADVEQIRARTKEKFEAAQQGAPPNKRRKADTQDADADDIEAAFAKKFT